MLSETILVELRLKFYSIRPDIFRSTALLYSDYWVGGGGGVTKRFTQQQNYETANYKLLVKT